jgi:hypothetical protein
MVAAGCVILETLLPLTALTRHGMGVLAMHHPSKAQPALGLAVRGSSALLGHVDISMEMRHVGGDPASRRRRLLALSRHSETPRQLVVELNPEATEPIPLWPGRRQARIAPKSRDSG